MTHFSWFPARIWIIAVIVYSPAIAGIRISSVQWRYDRAVIRIDSFSPEARWISLHAFEPYETRGAGQLLFSRTLSPESSAVTVEVPQLKSRDLLYAGFSARELDSQGNLLAESARCYMTDIRDSSQADIPFPMQCSKKGLNVLPEGGRTAMLVKDAISLGVRHVTLGIYINNVFKSAGKPEFSYGGTVYHINETYLSRMVDPIVRGMSDTGAAVYAVIVLHQASWGGDHQGQFSPFTHLKYHPEGKLSAFNLEDGKGTQAFRAVMEFLARRYSRSRGTREYRGRVHGWIIGNEVNLHWDWHNMGKTPPQAVADNYARTFRAAFPAVMKWNPNARLYVSLTREWSGLTWPDTLKCISGRDLIDLFNIRIKTEGDIPWNLAYHPYPFKNPHVWRDMEDSRITAGPDTRIITFRNLEVLTAYFRKDGLRFEGKPRSIILSEQGFTSASSPLRGNFSSETLQAAGYAYAWHRVANLEGIDAFTLHRQVDHEAEIAEGLALGIWTVTPKTGFHGRQKEIYGVFKHADRPDWRHYLDKYLQTYQEKGRPDLKTWDDVLEGIPEGRVERCGDEGRASP